MAPKISQQSASKKQKRNGKPPPAYDPKLFETTHVYERLIKVIINKQLIQERGFNLEDLHLPMIPNIERRKWFDFCCTPEAGVVPLVQEFHANAYTHRNRMVFVRKKRVSFSAKEINSFYKLTNIDDDEYSVFAKGDVDLEEVISTLCMPGTVWRTTVSGALNHFRTRALNKTAKAWHYFFATRLMPVSHTSHVTKDRAIVIYAIMKGMSIDVGRIISQSILDCSFAEKGGLFVPSLITGLCRKEKVAWEPREALIHSMKAIDSMTIEQYKDPVGTSNIGASTSEPHRHVPTKHRASASRANSLDSRHGDHWVETRALRQEMRQMHAYNVGCHNALAQMLHQCVLNIGGTISPLPEAPVFPPLPPLGDTLETAESDNEDD